MKNCKTFYEAQTASRLMEIVQPPSKPTPNQIKSYYDFGTKFFFRRYTEICFQSASRVEFLSVKKSCSANVFPHTKEKHVFGKFVKSERFLAGFETFC